MNSMLIIVAAVLVVVLAFFVLIQFKAGWYWRLVSIAFALFATGWSFYHLGRATMISDFGEYIRENRKFVEAVDQLAMKGRTNDIHQVCQKYLSVNVSINNLTNLDSVVEDAASRISWQSPTQQLPLKP